MSRKLRMKCMGLFVAFCLLLQGKEFVLAQPADIPSESEMAEESYAKGQALVMYEVPEEKDTEITLCDVMADTSDYVVEETYSFDYGNDEVFLEEYGGEEEKLKVSLVSSKTRTTEQIIEALQKEKDVLYAEPNYRIHTLDYKEASYDQYLWALNNTGQNGGVEDFDVQLPQSEPEDKKEYVVAVVDTGVDYTHPDLQDVMWNNPFDEHKLAGKHGYDFISKDDDPMDEYGHGTHCAGIIAGNNDGKGITGIAAGQTKIMSLRILDENGYGYSNEAVGAYHYIYEAQKLGVPVVAVNNSWGTSDSGQSKIFEILFNMLGENGAITVCAAGNSSSDNDLMDTFPANTQSDYVISVAASNEKDELAEFSNYGKDSVDLAAPGTDILSSVSYASFQPLIYENKEEQCSYFQDFSDVLPVESETMEEDNKKFAYYLKGEALQQELLTESEVFFGEKENGKALEWKIMGAKADKECVLYIPYTVGSSQTERVLSCQMFCKSGQSKEFAVVSVYDVEASGEDSALKDTEFEIEDTCSFTRNYWKTCQRRVGASSQEQNRVLKMVVTPIVDGDYTIYLDNFGISKDNAEQNSFGKYDFYCGTSMAAPYVAGAVVRLANQYKEDSTDDRICRLLGSVRKSEALKDKVSTGGVLDLSQSDSLKPLLREMVLNQEEQLVLFGYQLEGSRISINGETVLPVEQEEKRIAVDVSAYRNQTVDIEVQLSNQEIIKKQRCITYGQSLQFEQQFPEVFNDCTFLGDANKLYLISRQGTVSTLEEAAFDDSDAKGDSNGTMWNLNVEGGYLSPSEFDGIDESLLYQYDISLYTEPVLCNGAVYAIVQLDLGYLNKFALMRYQSGIWERIADVPENMLYRRGFIFAAYQGNLYLMGGYDEKENICKKDVYEYDMNGAVWIQKEDMIAPRAFSKAIQTGNQLVISLGCTQEEDYFTPITEDTFLPDVVKKQMIPNLTYDGTNWREESTEQKLVAQMNGIEYVGVGEEESSYWIRYFDGNIGRTKNGIMISDVFMEGYGDIVKYNLSNHIYETTGYRNVSTDISLWCDKKTTTMGNRLFTFVSNLSMEEFEEDMSLRPEDFDGEMMSGSTLYSMPIENGNVFVNWKEQKGVTIDAQKEYMPGEQISIGIYPQKNYKLLSWTLNGVKKSVSSKNQVYYTEKAARNLTISVNAECMASSMKLNKTKMTLRPGQSSKLTVSFLPKETTNKKVSFTSSNKKIATVSASGKVTVSRKAKAGKKVTITVTSKQNKKLKQKCVITVGRKK